MTATIERVSHDDPVLVPYLNDVISSSRDVWVGRLDGEVVLVWGLIPQSLLSETAYIWSLALPGIKKCPRAMLTLSKAWVAERLEEFTTLTGFTECKTSWLKHLGAEFHPGLERYHEFTIRAQ